MSRSKTNVAGLVTLCVGILMLVTGLLLWMTAGTVLVPICITGSVLVNTVGVTLMRHGREEGGRRRDRK